MEKLIRKQVLWLGVTLAMGMLLGVVLFGGGGHEAHTPAAAPPGETDTVWTCSMHPQIRQSEPGKCPICGMDLIPVSAEKAGRGAPASPFVYKMSPEAVALANVQTTRATGVVPEHEVHLIGKLDVDERRVGVIAASYPGRIEKLFVDFTGQEVRKGQKLATIYSPELVTAQKELLEAAKTRLAGPALYRAAREKLRLWRLTEAQMDAIETTGAIQTEFDVLSDLNGTVLSRRVSTGDYMSRGSVLFEIADLSRVWVMMDAYESDLPWVRIGAEVRFTAAAIPGKEFASTVTFIDPVINPQTRSASVRAEADNPGLALKPDMFVQSRIRSAHSQAGNQLLIPKTAVLWTGPRSVVFVKVSGDESPAFEMREIRLGPRAGDHYVVESGLSEGEDVVTHGVFAVDAAAQLSGSTSMMSRPTGGDVGGQTQRPRQEHRH